MYARDVLVVLDERFARFRRKQDLEAQQETMAPNVQNRKRLPGENQICPMVPL
jgi:hypothetical protein